MDNVCRTCLTDRGERISILNSCNEFENSFSYTEMVQEIASIQVSLDDGFSTLICKSCIENLEKAFAFRLQCQKSDEMLRQSKINNIDIKIEEPDGYKDFYDHEINDGFNSDETYIKTEVDVVLTEINNETIDYGKKTEPEIKTMKKNKKSVSKIKRNRKKITDSEGLNKIKTKRKIIKSKPSIKPPKDTTDEETTDDCFDDLTESEKKVQKRSDHHFYELTETGEVQYPCFVCKEVFKSHLDFITHAKTHNENKPYICRQCGNCYTTLSGLRIHYPKHIIGLSHCCEICGKIFVKSGDLVVHIRRHTGEKPFSCPHCNSSFASKKVLSSHVQMHDTAKFKTCKVCGKKLRKIGTHMNIHRTEKLYCCHLCGNKFTFKGELNAHMVVHTGDKKYVCTVCSKAFGWSSSLRKHMLIHTNKRAFVCDVCGKDFMHKHVMQAHRRKH